MRFAFAFSAVSSLPLPSTIANTTSASVPCTSIAVRRMRAFALSFSLLSGCSIVAFVPSSFTFCCATGEPPPQSSEAVTSPVLRSLKMPSQNAPGFWIAQRPSAPMQAQSLHPQRLPHVQALLPSAQQELPVSDAQAVRKTRLAERTPATDRLMSEFFMGTSIP